VSSLRIRLNEQSRGQSAQKVMGYSCSEVRSMSPKTDSFGVASLSNITTCTSLDIQATSRHSSSYHTTKGGHLPLSRFNHNNHVHCKGTSVHSLTFPVSHHVYMYSPQSLYTSDHTWTTPTFLRSSTLLINISIFDNSANLIATKVDASQLPSPTSE
jgi:hypothetical protein